MNKTTKEIINVILVIIFTYIHVHYISPSINKFFNGRFASLGIWLIFVGIWGYLVGFSVIKSFFLVKNYKIENYIFMCIGIVLLIVAIFQKIL